MQLLTNRLKWPLIFFLFPSILLAQNVQLVRDIQPGSNNSIPVYFEGDFISEGAVIGGIFYFTANDGASGVELWRTDGTENGTQMVKDIHQGAGNSNPRRLTKLGDRLLFFADDGQHGYELWVSDGTENGTQLVKDINAGADGCIRINYTAQRESQFVLNGVLYFAADADGHYSQLWRTDGNEQGTFLVKDVCPGCTASSGTTGWFTGLNNTLYFIAEDDLWKSTGTATGTTKITDDSQGSAPKKPEYLRAAGNKLYFAAQKNGVVDVEPWISTGTTAGTQLLLDANPGNFSGTFPHHFTVYKNSVYFIGSGTLWSTNGTANGTAQFSTLNSGEYYGQLGEGFNFLVANSLLFFNAREPGGNNQEYLYVTDGTPNNINQIAATNNYGFGNIGLVADQNKVCFWGEENNNIGIWTANGTTEGKFFTPSNSLFNARELWVADDNLFFFMSPASPSIGVELFKMSLTSPVPLVFDIAQTTDILCAGKNTATLSVQITNGTPPYQYLWNNPSVQGANPGNLGAGAYTVTVTDAFLNTAVQSITITEPLPLILSAQTNAATGSASNGSAELMAAGGTAPYSYLWNTGAMTQVLSDVPAGNYSATVTDSNDCSATLNVAIPMTTTSFIPANAYLQVFPTLNKGTLQVLWNGVPLRNVRLQVVDQQGTIQRQWDGWTGDELSLAGLPAGLYWLRLKSDNLIAQQEFILLY